MAKNSSQEFREQTDEARPRLLRIARRMVGADAAEDVVQIALLRTWRDRDRLTGPGCYRRYAITVTRTAAIDYLRTRNRKQFSSLEETFGSVDTLDRSYVGPPNPEDVALESLETDKLLDTLKHLPRQEAILLYQRFGLDMTYNEIASHSGVQKSDVSARMRVALRSARSRHGRPAWIGSLPWAILWSRGLKTKAALAGVPAGPVVGTAAVGVTAIIGLAFAGGISGSSPTVDLTPVAAVTTVTSSAAPAPATSSQLPTSKAPSATPSPKASPKASPSPSRAPSSSPAPASPTRAAAPVIPTPATTTPSAPGTRPAPPLPTRTPEPATVITPVCAYRSGQVQVVKWHVVNNTNRTFTVSSYSGIIDSAAVTIAAHSDASWQQTDHAGRGSTWSAGTIGGHLSAGKVRALPTCTTPVTPSDLTSAPAAPSTPTDPSTPTA